MGAGGLRTTTFCGGGSGGGLSGLRLRMTFPSVSDSPLSSSCGSTGLSRRLMAEPFSVSLICCFCPESFMGSMALLLAWPYDTVPWVILLFSPLRLLPTLEAELLREKLDLERDLDLEMERPLEIDLEEAELDLEPDRDLERLDENVLPGLPLGRDPDLDRDLE